MRRGINSNQLGIRQARKAVPRAEKKEARQKGRREAPLGAGACTLTCDLEKNPSGGCQNPKALRVQ